jgi:hypothetical protein
MPKPIIADWNLATVLYTQGVPYAEIAQRIGVTEAALRQRSHRHKWRQLRTTALQTVSQSVTARDTRTLVQRSRVVREALGADLDASVAALQQVPVTPDLKHLDQRVEVAAKVAGAAAKVFDWEGQKAVGLVVVGDVAQLMDPEEEAPIDIESTQAQPGTATSPEGG